MIAQKYAHDPDAQCLQSDEGGRFYRSITRYRVVEIGENVELPSSGFYCWLTLAQIHLLLKETGMVTNEARSAISLLLSYL